MVVLAAIATVLLSGVAGPTAHGAGDPTLSVDRAAVLAALHCPATFARPRLPVLLVHGTGSTAEESWSHTFAKTLPLDGHDVCTVDLPARALGDIQVSAEYVVAAIHEVSGRAGRKIDVVGHSQGGLEPRWALKWFPSTRALVDDDVTISSTHHGSADAAGACAAGSCAPSVWQQRPGSMFLNALNTGDETPGDVSYTSIYSLTDEVVPELPPPSTSMLAGARNVAIQDACPGRPDDHFSILWDAVAHAIVDDALDHPGPADPARLGSSVCFSAIAPGLDASDVAYMHTVALGQTALSTLVTGPKSSAEPALMPYVLAAQSSASAASTPPNDQAGPQPAAPATRQPSASRAVHLAATGGTSTIVGPALVALALALSGRRLRRRSP